jgi:hypothetical protein
MGGSIKKEDIELFENMDSSRLKNIILFISFLGYTYYLTRLF